MSKCTIFENIYIKDKPIYIPIDMALERIRTGAKSKDKVMELRACIDEDLQSEMKKNLPCVCFSGEFTTRYDTELKAHSGYLVLDFDGVEDTGEMAAKIAANDFIYALWVSPRGNGLKALIRIADGKKHREHFAALKEIFPDIDNSGVNESRVCYESYDPNIYIKKDAATFTKIKTIEKYQGKEIIDDEAGAFNKLLKWLANKRVSFSKGERNSFIFKLASACCRFGIHEDSCINMILREYPSSNDFTQKEAINTIKSGYRSSKSKSGTAHFEKDVLIEKVSRKEVVIDAAVFDETIPPRDVIYAQSVKRNAFEIFNNGYAKITGIGVPKIDERWKSKKGETTVLTGIGNYGKSAWNKWNKLMRVLLYGEKFASFSPEDNPPEEYYIDFVEILLGCNCTPTNFDGTPNHDKPNDTILNNAYDFVGKHIFYLAPGENEPTIDYVLERFLELIFKEKISGCAIDPWNKLSHNYALAGGNVSKYLELVLDRVLRFAQVNNVYMDLIVHPKTVGKNGTGNFDCPDVFDLNDGAMWNNKVDNILVYHRPLRQTDPRNPLCEFHSKKIKRQKTVGKPGYITCEYAARTRRFEIDGADPIQALKNLNNLDFHAPIQSFTPAVANPLPDNALKGFQQNTQRLPNDFWNNE